MEELKVKIVGVTSTDPEVIEAATKEKFELDGGHSANICYTQKSFDEIISEDESKTKDRAEGNKENKHHSVFGHDYISLYFEGIPKIIAMMINNEKDYNTSEKSGRYTVMFGNEKENELYNKWRARFESMIKEYYPNEKYLDDKMIKKKALENARYLLSLFMRTKMEYTVSYRQLNYLHTFAERMINEPTTNPLIVALKPYLEEFKDTLESTGFITKGMNEYRNREYSLFADFNDYEEQFGRAYSVNYDLSIPALADIQRHRTLDYQFSLPEEKKFFVPPIIEATHPELVDEWLYDISNISEFPQGMMVNVNETGKWENLILKMYERVCTAPQLEVMRITRETYLKYLNALRQKVQNGTATKGDLHVLSELEKYDGPRCTFPGFNCPQPCEFAEGVKLTRKI